jgi:hypothetical protein
MKKISLIFTAKNRLSTETNTTRIPVILASSLLVVVSLVYFLILGRGLFIFHENNILFIYSAEYFRSFTEIPGGLLDYAGNFLIQFCFDPYYGTVIFTVVTITAFLLFRKLIRTFADSNFNNLLAAIPAFSLLLLQSGYDFQLRTELGILFSVGLFLSARKINPSWITILLFPPLFYLTGSCSFIYAGLIIINSIISLRGKQRILYLLVQITSVILTCFLFREVLFLQPPDKILVYPLFQNGTLKMTMLYVLFSLYVVLLPVSVKALSELHLKDLVVRVAEPSGIIAVAVISVFILIDTYDPVLANVMKFERMVSGQDWEGIIREHEKIRSTNVVEQYYYNLALAEKGILCDRMFFGRQSFGSMALTLVRNDEQSYRAMYFYYMIGLSEEAHHLAFEQMVQHGYRPENIKMLIKTELINGNFKPAGRYIEVLKRTLHYRTWAVKYERMLFRPEAVSADPELGKQIRNLPGKDFYVVTDDFRNVEMLVQSNPSNRIAFEYKLARLLFDKDLTEIGKLAAMFKSLGYQHFPRHIEEALVSLVNVTGQFPDMGGLTISSDTDKRFIAYFENLKPFHNDRNLIEKGIRKEERNTFWYYLQLGHVRNTTLKNSETETTVY